MADAVTTDPHRSVDLARIMCRHCEEQRRQHPDLLGIVTKWYYGQILWSWHDPKTTKKHRQALRLAGIDIEDSPLRVPGLPPKRIGSIWLHIPDELREHARQVLARTNEVFPPWEQPPPTELPAYCRYHGPGHVPTSDVRRARGRVSMYHTAPGSA